MQGMRLESAFTARRRTFLGKKAGLDNAELWRGRGRADGKSECPSGEFRFGVGRESLLKEFRD